MLDTAGREAQHRRITGSGPVNEALVAERRVALPPCVLGEAPMLDSRQRPRPFTAFDLPDETAARIAAQRIADRIGRVIVVTDDNGDAVCTVRPTPRRDEVTLYRGKN
jgi:hypothetical protein